MTFNGSEKEQAYVIVLLISCVYGTIASTAIIILIYHMNMTGNLRCSIRFCITLFEEYCRNSQMNYGNHVYRLYQANTGHVLVSAIVRHNTIQRC